MKEVKWVGCVAHTLHLVIGKGLMPAQILILRAKRLIDFFLRPKQSERLEEIQKQFPIENELIENEKKNEDEEKESDNEQNNEENEEISELIQEHSKLVSFILNF